MKNKKLISALLAAVLMTAPLLSGCSDSLENTDPYNPLLPLVSSEQTSAQPSDAQPSAVVSYPDASQDSTDASTPRTSTPQTSTPQTSTDTSTPQPTSDDLTPAMWKVENGTGNYIYMMGTIHVGDDSVNSMPEYVEDAYNWCDSIAVEANISEYLNDTSKAASLASSLIYTDGTTIKDHISEETYNAAVERLKQFNMYQPTYDYMIPYMWMSILSTTMADNTGLSYYKGVDMAFINRATNDNKNIIEVESITFQLDLFKSFSDELGELLISQMLDPDYENYVNIITVALFNRWKTGTVGDDLIDSSTFKSSNPEIVPLIEEYNNKLLSSRNTNMAKTVEQYVDNGDKVFFMVGILHFYGENGIIELLRKDGYTVTPVP